MYRMCCRHWMPLVASWCCSLGVFVLSLKDHWKQDSPATINYTLSLHRWIRLPQSIVLMKCHLLKSHPLSKAWWWCLAKLPLLGHAKTLDKVCVSIGDAGATAWPVPWWKQAEPRQMGRAWQDNQSITRWEHHCATAAVMPQESKLWLCSLFKMQLCKGHRGGDETRSCNKEGEIKNNDRNKLS